MKTAQMYILFTSNKAQTANPRSFFTFAGTMRHYPAKLLLFGEHLLLLGAPALALPAPIYNGQWQKSAAGAQPWAEQLLDFAQSAVLRKIPALDVESFQQDIAAGWYFESNIPPGYGLGSSGALCAAVYDKYCREKSDNPAALKILLAQMEQHFHGASSGIDPLTSYLNHAIRIDDKDKVSLVNLPHQAQMPEIFLLDTQQARQANRMIAWFRERTQEPAFATLLEKELLPAHQNMLEAWIAGDPDNFRAALKIVSAFQLTHQTAMIPAHIRPIWQKGLDSDHFYLKLCGAGGGGFVLAFSMSTKGQRLLESQHQLIKPFARV